MNVKSIRAVVGANWGDEGKGLMVDYFAAKDPKNTLVVRFNGGAQAGHTVTTPDGLRHVFSHFGSGSAAGASTYLTSDFVVNPMVFRKEWTALNSKGINPTIYIDKGCRITLPFDMIVNMLIERKRGIKRHGSCGLGIFETVFRSKFPNFQFSCLYLSSSDWRFLLESALGKYMKEYIWRRIAREEYDLFKEFGDHLMIGDRFIEDCEFLRQKAVFSHEGEELRNYKHLIFEGAQGLLLDQSNKLMAPHLTPSSTGLRNIARVLNTAGMCIDKNFEAVYVTRTYLTRHGAGPMAGECSKEELFGNKAKDIHDKTNVPNEFQGALRYGKLTIPSLIDRIKYDVWRVAEEAPKISLAVTHTNELPVPEIGNVFDRFYYSGAETRESVSIHDGI